MKKQYKTNAINLKSSDFGEYDRIITMYSEDKGLIKCMAKGTKRPGSKLGGRCETFVANNLILSEGKSMDNICTAEVLNSFFKLRLDTDKMFYSMYCTEIVKNFGTENDTESKNVYKLLFDVLNQIASAEADKNMLLGVIKFQLKILKIFGCAPELNNCTVCNRKINDEYSFFSFEDGGLVCNLHNTSHLPRIHPKIKEFLKTLLQTDFNIETRYDKLADNKVCKPCFELLKNYTEYHSPKKFNSIKVLETV